MGEEKTRRGFVDYVDSTEEGKTSNTGCYTGRATHRSANRSSSKLSGSVILKVFWRLDCLRRFLEFDKRTRQDGWVACQLRRQRVQGVGWLHLKVLDVDGEENTSWIVVTGGA